MAVNKEESQKNIESLISQGVPQSSIVNYGNKLNPTEANSILSTFRASGNPYSVSNVASAMTNPAKSPDYNDIYGIRERINTELGLSTVQKEYQDAIAGLRGYDTGTQAQQTNLEGQVVPLGVIRGEQDTALRQRSLERQSLADKAAILQDRFQAVQNEANTRFNLANQERERTLSLIYQNPSAGITLTDRPDVIASKIEGARIKEEKRVMKISKEAEENAYKKQLKAALIEVGQKTKGSVKELEKRLRKYNASALAEAKALARQKTGGSGTAGQRAGAVVSQAQNALLSSRGTDGKVDPGVYAKYRAQYASETGDVSGFDSQFGSLLSPQEQTNIGVQMTGTKPPTQAQAIASGYAQRAQEATGIINKYEKLGAELIGKVSGADWFPTVLKSSDRQQLEQAQRNFVNAVLRPESGAVISEQEFDNASKQYFPQPGEGAAVIAQKRANRETKIQNLQTTAGASNQTPSQDEVQQLKNAGYTDEQIQMLMQ